MVDEIQVLRYFETGPIEKVEVVFNIVCAKMRERLDQSAGSADASSPRTDEVRRRSRRMNMAAPSGEQRQEEGSTA